MFTIASILVVWGMGVLSGHAYKDMKCKEQHEVKIEAVAK